MTDSSAALVPPTTLTPTPGAPCHVQDCAQDPAAVPTQDPLATSRQVPPVAPKPMLTEMPQDVAWGSPAPGDARGLSPGHRGCSSPSLGLPPLPRAAGTVPESQEAAGASARSRFSRVAARCRQPSAYPGLCGAGAVGPAGAEPGAGGLGEPAGSPRHVPNRPGPSRTGRSVVSSIFPPAGAPHTRSREPTPGVLATFPALQPRTVSPVHPGCSRD